MRTIRLTCPEGLRPEEGEEIFLAPDQARHGVLVLRLSPGAEVELIGPPGLARARVTTAGFSGPGANKKNPRLGVVLSGPWAAPVNEAPGPRLALALIQGQRFDWAVEKAVELGAAALLPLVTERTKAADGRPGPAKVARWRRLAEEARKQCGRSRPLEIEPVISLADLARQRPGPGFFLSPQGGREPARPAAEAGNSPLLVIGPEGGLTPAEEEALAQAGLEPWSLGPTILRAETAALAALALITTGHLI